MGTGAGMHIFMTTKLGKNKEPRFLTGVEAMMIHGWDKQLLLSTSEGAGGTTTTDNESSDALVAESLASGGGVEE